MYSGQHYSIESQPMFSALYFFPTMVSSRIILVIEVLVNLAKGVVPFFCLTVLHLQKLLKKFNRGPPKVRTQVNDRIKHAYFILTQI